MKRQSPFDDGHATGGGDRTIAAALCAALALAAAAATPFSKDALAPLPGYMLAFGSTMVVTNLILGSLLLNRGQASRDGSAVLLGSVYMFVGLVFLPMTAAFPGALSAGSLIGTTYSPIWIWTFWHAGFGAGIVAHALRRAPFQWRPWAAFWSVAAIVAFAACAATVGVDSLPRVFGEPARGMFTGRGEAVGWSLLAVDVLALGLTLRRARESSERMWLAVAMAAACFDVWLTFHAGARFSVGWYLGKVGSLATTMVVLVSMVNNLSVLYAKVSLANQALANLAKLDGLTGVANRRGFDEALEAESRRAARASQDIALLMVDVDWFKLYNDRYGHQAGDECLRSVAAALAACAKRPGDSVCRYGGEEFALLLPATGLRGAMLVAERVVASVAGLAIEHTGSFGGSVSVSVGVASGNGRDGAALVRAADKALYAAKREGRDRAVASDAWLPSESLAPEVEPEVELASQPN